VPLSISRAKIDVVRYSPSLTESVSVGRLAMARNKRLIQHTLLTMLMMINILAMDKLWF
jgi:hypothetical protein